jgi:hypothetical protein
MLPCRYRLSLPFDYLFPFQRYRLYPSRDWTGLDLTDGLLSSWVNAVFHLSTALTSVVWFVDHGFKNRLIIATADRDCCLACIITIYVVIKSLKSKRKVVSCSNGLFLESSVQRHATYCDLGTAGWNWHHTWPHDIYHDGHYSWSTCSHRGWCLNFTNISPDSETHAGSSSRISISPKRCRPH